MSSSSSSSSKTKSKTKDKEKEKEKPKDKAKDKPKSKEKEKSLRAEADALRRPGSAGSTDALLSAGNAKLRRLDSTLWTAPGSPGSPGAPPAAAAPASQLETAESLVIEQRLRIAELEASFEAERRRRRKVERELKRVASARIAAAIDDADAGNADDSAVVAATEEESDESATAPLPECGRCARLARDLATATAAERQSRRRADRRKIQLTETQARLADATTARSEAVESADAAARYADRLKAQLANAEQRAEAAAAAAQRAARAEVAAAEAREESVRLAVECGALKGQLSEARAARREPTAAPDADAAALRIELASTTRELDESEEQCAQLAALLRAARAAHDELRDRLAEADARSDDAALLRQKVARLEAARGDVGEALEAERAEQRAVRDAMRAAHDATVSELEATKEALEEARSAASDARSLYEATLDQSEERANQCDRLQAAAAELRSELFEVQQALANANSEERTLRDRLLEQTNKVMEQENSLIELRSRTAALVATRREATETSDAKVPKGSDKKAVAYWRSLHSQEVERRTALELLLAEKASDTFMALDRAARLGDENSELKRDSATLQKQIDLLNVERSKLADGYVRANDEAAKMIDRLRSERDDFRERWQRSIEAMQDDVATPRHTRQSSTTTSVSISIDTTTDEINDDEENDDINDADASSSSDSVDLSTLPAWKRKALENSRLLAERRKNN